MAGTITADTRTHDTGRLRSPAWHAVAITPDDNNDLALVPAKGLYIGVAGHVKVDLASGAQAVTFKGCPAGSILNVQVTRVYSTTTTATDIVALY